MGNKAPVVFRGEPVSIMCITPYHNAPWSESNTFEENNFMCRLITKSTAMALWYGV